jgi:hypothetical protein
MRLSSSKRSPVIIATVSGVVKIPTDIQIEMRVKRFDGRPHRLPPLHKVERTGTDVRRK